MLGPDVQRLKFAAVLLLALLTVGQLAVHHHSLTPEAGSTALVCGVCAVSADTTDPSVPIVAPLVVTAIVAEAVEQAPESANTLTVAARGPPQI
jgi:hypothetical protein